MPNPSLLAILYCVRSSRCTNTHDRVYALLGIRNDGEGIKVDYNSSIHDLYINWTWDQIENTKRLEVLNACNDSKAVGLPSWVPNLENGLAKNRNDLTAFVQTVCVDGLHFHDSSGKLLYSASGRSLCDPTLSADGRILSLFGMHSESNARSRKGS